MNRRVRSAAKSMLPSPILDAIRRRRSGAPARSSSSRRQERAATGDLDRVDAAVSALLSDGDSGGPQLLHRTREAQPRGSVAHARASLGLARWYLGCSDAQRALDTLDGCSGAPPELDRSIRLLRADAQLARGGYLEASIELARVAGRSTNDPDLLLRIGATNVAQPDDGRGSGPMIEMLNTIWSEAGFVPVRRTSVDRTPALVNLTAPVEPAEPRESLPVLTVGTWLGPADPDIGLVSLLAQSWQNLEILVAGRPTEHPSWSILSADPRVSIVRVDAPELGWAAFADQFGSGKLVTIASPIVWSHPQRFEAQLGALQSNGARVGSVCSRAVLGDRLVPCPLGRWPGERLVGPHPDLLVVRSGRDDDVVDRLRSSYSPSTGVLAPVSDLEHVAADVPLALEMDPHLGVSEVDR